VEFLDKGNADNFYKVLKIFYQELINEWVEAGNQAKDFAEKGAKIVIILDNARFHKKAEYLEKIEAEMPNLHLEFLPEYSPDYNLIELVWHSTKEYIANRKKNHEVAKLNNPPFQKEKSGNKDAAKTELIEKLKEHEEGWLHELCTGYKPLWILGDMGSWKSYCGATIALCRYYLNDWEINSICDPHGHQNKTEAWKELLNLEPSCYGASQNWQQIDEGLKASFERWNTRTMKDPIITSIFDEVTNYSKHDECKESAKEFSSRAISDPRKAAEGIIMIAHAFSNAATGGSEGYAEARTGNSIQLRLTSTNQMKPTFKEKLTGFKNEDGEVLEDLAVTIPKEWFTPEKIRAMFD
jgi:hypothetical protein